MYPKAVLAALSVASLCAVASAPAFAGFVDPDFDWRDSAFSASSGVYGQNPTAPDGSTSFSSGSSSQSTSFTSTPGVSGESRFIHEMTLNGVSTTVTIESFNPTCTDFSNSYCRKTRAVMTWDNVDGIGVTQKDPDYTNYEVDEIEGKNEILRFSFSDPIEISAIYVSDLFKNEEFDHSDETYDEWGFFRLNSDTFAQIYDDETFKFTAGGDLEQDGDVVGELIDNDASNGEWKIVLPTPVVVSTIDFWAKGSFYEKFWDYCQWVKKYGGTEFALAGVDGVPPQNVPEPGPLGLVVAGLLGLGVARYRRNRG